MTAVSRSCIFDTEGKLQIDRALFLERLSVLTKYIARNDELELESLFAIQALDHKLLHPQG